MPSEWTLKLLPAIPGWTIVALAGATIALLAWSYRRPAAEAGRRLARLLAALRALAIATIAAALLGPTVRTYVWAGQRGRIAVVVDDTESLTIPDAGASGEGLTRAAARTALLEGRRGLVSRIGLTAAVDLFAFGESLRAVESLDALAAADGSTDIAGALVALPSAVAGGEGRTVAAVLVSDGADTEGGQIEPALRRLASSGLPVYTVAVGGSEFRDIEVAELRTTRTVRKDTLVSVATTIRSRGIQPMSAPVRLLELTKGTGAGEGAAPPKLIAEQRAQLGGAPVKVGFEFLPSETGFREYAVEVPTADGEVVSQNNRREFALTVERRKIRVIYMEGSEYRRPERQLWEFQYLEEALKEDGDIEVTSLLRKEVASARDAGIFTVQDPVHGFPRTKKALFEYDVIVSSDIDIDFFTREQLEYTVEFVGKRGGGFVMVGGWTAFGAGGYDESVIDKALPVDMVGRKHEGYKENDPFRIEVTDEALRHPVMQLDPDPDRNRMIWGMCPEFNGYNQIQRAKPGATVLATHERDKTLYGPAVILAVQQYGRGRSMAMTTDTTAGWGTRFEEEFGEDGDNRYYRKFWQNAIRWLAEYRLAAPSRLAQIELGSALAARGEKERVCVTALDEYYEPAAGADVKLRISGPGGKSTESSLPADPSQPGLYAADVVFTELGRHTLEATVSVKGTPIGTDRVAIAVRPSSREFERPEVNTGLLKKIAERSGGKYYESCDASRIPEDIGDLVASIRRHEDRSLWDTVWVWLALVVLLSAEWGIRKRAGLP